MITIRSKALYFIVFVIFLYLILGTGIHGDDYCEIMDMRNYTFIDYLKPDLSRTGFLIFGLPSYYTLMAFRYAWSDSQFVLDLVKVIVHLFAYFSTFYFFKGYLSEKRSAVAALIFLLYPSHEVTMYWYMTLPYILVPSSLFYSHALIRNEKYLFGFMMSLIGSFAFYSSPPFIVGLTCIFLYEKKYKHALCFAIPGVAYICFYFAIKYFFPGAEYRVNSHQNIIEFLKQLFIQPISIIDAVVGPSFFIKIYYAISSLSVLSFLISLCILIVLMKTKYDTSETRELPKSLFIGLLIVLVTSFVMYAMTGLYQHSSFNLGNRSTLYGSLLMAFLLAMLPFNKKSILFLSLIIVFPAFGLSDSWKSWNMHQKAVIESIHANPALNKLSFESTLLITGNIYSRLGPFSHIEFFSMPWVVTSIFHDGVKSKSVVALAPYIELDHGSLVDPKFGGRYPLGNKIYVYNSEANTVSPIALAAVPQLLAARPREIRHWVQLAKGTWIESSIVALSPRLVYLFQ